MECTLTQPIKDSLTHSSLNTYLVRLLLSLNELQRKDFILQLEFLANNTIPITRQRIDHIYAVISVTTYASEEV